MSWLFPSRRWLPAGRSFGGMDGFDFDMAVFDRALWLTVLYQGCNSLQLARPKRCTPPVESLAALRGFA
jgi:hypothetical protein